MAEKTRRIPRKTKAVHLCTPKLIKGDAAKNSRKAPTPMTLLERLREAVFRFIMLCALSKATNHHSTGAGFHDDIVRRRHSYQNADHHHSEAVADCIEFIKKKAYSDDEIIHDGGSMDADADADVAVPVPVG